MEKQKVYEWFYISQQNNKGDQKKDSQEVC